MTKRPTITSITSGYASASTLDENFENIRDQFDNTLSRDGSTPNVMEADFDLNSNNLLNADYVYANRIYLNGVRVADFSTTLNWEGAWATATAYTVDDLVSNDGNTYICIEDHTSGTFSTDLAASKWALFASKGAAGAGTGDMLAANNLSDVADSATSRTNLGVPIDTDTHAADVIFTSKDYATEVLRWDNSSNEWEFSKGFITVGEDDTTEGNLYLYGSATSGGDFRIYNAADADATVDYYQIRAASEDLIFELDDGTDFLRYDASDGWIELSGNAVAEGGFYLLERAAAPADVAGHGQFWVKNDTPNTPWFTDDAGTDHSLLGLGVGQTWQDLTASRSANTSYQNTSGKPIQVSIYARNSAVNIAFAFQASTDGSTWVDVANGTTNNADAANVSIQAIIPDDHYYRFTATSSYTELNWSELR